MKQIIEEALQKYKPKKILLLFSGGHDSLCATHYAANYLSGLNIPFEVYHGNTGIGIKETRQFVYSTCKRFGWKLYEGHPDPGDTYEDMVRKHGFPGPPHHRYTYRFLKERALRKYVTHVCKSSPQARENVLLITGLRQSESRIRMGYKEPTRKENSMVWCNAIFYWTKDICERYMLAHNLPRNPVKDKICISGECLCGAFARREEWIEIKNSFPDAAKEIERLHKIAIEHGHPWEWASNPNEYEKLAKRSKKMFMCVGCEEKNERRLLAA